MFKVAWSRLFHHPLPEGHRFPMEKYSLLQEQLVHEGTIEPAQLFEPRACSNLDISLTHTWEYINDLDKGTLSQKAMRSIGFPASPQLVEREKVICGGTWECVEHAFEEGVSFNLAGGTHHSSAHKGEGFCLFNDNAVASNLFLQKNPKAKILILDLDVHQGNGTASIFQDSESVFTFSMHGKNNYPLHKENSHWDIELDDNTSDKDYLILLEGALAQLGETKFDLLFYQAGVDILASDKLGRLGVSIAGCKKRDETVFNFAKKHEIPTVVTMGGGYSPEIKDIIQAHANTYRVANSIY
ncbi:MAG: acetoin utilization deacetylase AcuC-like enzyme [Luteibaculaceae bacterium]|jgi:acetoin utilization deacetylase AcuC-like enzyme